MSQREKEKTQNHIYSLDVLRSAAIILVMMWHSPKVNGHSYFGFLGENGLWGVDLFFVLSGYLIGNQLFKSLQRSGRISLLSFYLRRGLRTLPNYLVVLAIYAFVPAYWEHPQLPPIWKFLTFTQNFNLTFSAFSHAWSLCIEEQFYLLLPFFSLLLFKRVHRNFILGLILSVLLSGMLLRGLLWVYYVEPDSTEAVSQYFSKIYYPTWTRLDGILLGVSVAALRNFWLSAWEQVNLRGNWFLVVGLSLCSFGFFLQTDRYELLPTILGYPILSLGFSAILMAALSPCSVINRLRIPGVELISTLSYSLYLLHKQVFHISSVYFDRSETVNPLMRFGVAFVASFAAAALLYILVERPFLRIRDRLESKRAS